MYYLSLGLQQYKAINNQGNNDLAAICHLAQSHSPGLRNKAALRYEKFVSSDVESISSGPLLSAKEEIAFKCPSNKMETSIRTMLKQVEQMPKGEIHIGIF